MWFPLFSVPVQIFLLTCVRLVARTEGPDTRDHSVQEHRNVEGAFLSIVALGISERKRGKDRSPSEAEWTLLPSRNCSSRRNHIFLFSSSSTETRRRRVANPSAETVHVPPRPESRWVIMTHSEFRGITGEVVDLVNGALCDAHVRWRLLLASV